MLRIRIPRATDLDPVFGYLLFCVRDPDPVYYHGISPAPAYDPLDLDPVLEPNSFQFQSWIKDRKRIHKLRNQLHSMLKARSESRTSPSLSELKIMVQIQKAITNIHDDFCNENMLVY